MHHVPPLRCARSVLRSRVTGGALAQRLEATSAGSRWGSTALYHACDDPERAVFYPEDDRFLLERDLCVSHYDAFE
jgi:hypothetical protein